MKKIFVKYLKFHPKAVRGGAIGWHLLNPMNKEYTMCGIAFDGDAENALTEPSVEKYEGKVTCKNCKEVIRSCRAAKI